MNPHIFVLFLVVFLGLANITEAASPRYIDNFDGTVTDTTTGLMWMRCAIGQTWDGTTCNDLPRKHTWAEANQLTSNFAGYTDWRLPNLRELIAMTDFTKSAPSLDSALFPVTPAASFWSVSPNAEDNNLAWYVNFYYGSVNYANKFSTFNLRLVRAGHYFDHLKDARDLKNYIDNKDGTVTDILSCFMWKRCTEGQTWDGNTCTGTSKGYDWNNASHFVSNFAGYDDWRLPTLDELIALLDYPAYAPAINRTWFPNVILSGTKSNFWSNSLLADNGDYAWGVDFYAGSANYSDLDSLFSIRLMRKSECFDIFSLNVDKLGSGLGTVIANNQNEIMCGRDCSERYTSDMRITLTAIPDSGHLFQSWGGACTGSSNTSTVSMTEERNVTATFKPQTYTLIVTPLGVGKGAGTVSSVPTGIDCGRQCSHDFVTGTAVTLTATPDQYSTLSGWSGGECSGTGTCTVTMTMANGVTAHFKEKINPLTVTKAGSGTGSVSSEPAGIDCGSDCSGAYPATTTITLYATPANDSRFMGWSGACTGTDPCTLPMIIGRKINAIFDTKATQTISAIVFSGPLTINEKVTAQATASSKLPVTLTTLTADICTVSGTTVTGIRTGTCTVVANQSGNADYQAARQVTKNVTVEKNHQTITVMAFIPNQLAVDGQTTVNATTSSRLAVTFTSSTPTICTLNGNIVNGIAAGTCSVTANQPGNELYQAAPRVTQEVLVTKGTQKIKGLLFDPPSLAVNDTTTISATTNSGLSVIFATDTPKICTVRGKTVTGIATGICRVTANQTGNDNYQAAPSISAEMTVDKGKQTISAITVDIVPLSVGTTATLTAMATSGLPVVFNSLTPDICVSHGTNGVQIMNIAVGQCRVAANQTGDANYSPASPVIQDFAVEKGGQTIDSIQFNPNFLTVGATTKITAHASSDLTVEFRSATPTICSTQGSHGVIVTGLFVGDCKIVMTQPGNFNYHAAPTMTKKIIVNRGTQTITNMQFEPLPVNGSTTVSATASSGLSVNFIGMTPDVCTVSGNTVTGITAGTCIVAAHQEGDVNYQAAPQVSVEIIVAPGQQRIGTLHFKPNSLAVNENAKISATATTGLPVTFSSTTPDICTINRNTVTGIAAGRCTVMARQAGNANYLAAPPVQKNIMVTPGQQTIGPIYFTQNSLAVNEIAEISATATSGLPVMFTSITPNICTISGNTLTTIAAGTCTVVADQAGNADYLPAPKMSQDITVAKGDQKISVIHVNPNHLVVNGTTKIRATTTSGLRVTFSSTTPDICTIQGNTLTGISEGICTVIAHQAGNANYLAAPQVVKDLLVAQSE